MIKKGNYLTFFSIVSLLFITSLKAQMTNYTSLKVGHESTITDDDLTDKFSLFVGKGILTEDIAIAKSDFWADYVFEDDYNLLPLKEVEAFIDLKGHLPNIPSSRDVSEKGYNMHSINVLLLEKIEELTLHMIAQEKRISQMETQHSNSKVQK